MPRPVGPGGLVPLVKPALEHFGGDWLFAPSTESDRDVARNSPDGVLHDGIKLRIVDIPRRAQHDHYATVSNDLLKLLFHYLLELPYEPCAPVLRSAWRNYRTVNEAFARAVRQTPSTDPILVQDYHLMLVGAALRRGSRQTRLGGLHYFHHVPWCEPDYFSALPADVANEILTGMLAYDTLGFHTSRWATAFIGCCERFVPGAVCSDGILKWRRRTVDVKAIPGGIDTRRVQVAAASAPTQRWVADLRRRSLGRWTLVRVDRLDLWKNALRGFLALEHLLDRRPNLASKIWFLALLTMPRTSSRAIETYAERCMAVVRRVNDRFGESSSGSEPISVLLNRDPEGDDRARALAGMQVADAAIVNPLFDGMNLVAKECCIVSERDLALILSCNAGASDELGNAALSINPFDVAETGRAIEQAFEMTREERRRRAVELRKAVESNPPVKWVEGQLA